MKEKVGILEKQLGEKENLVELAQDELAKKEDELSDTKQQHDSYLQELNQKH